MKKIFVYLIPVVIYSIFSFQLLMSGCTKEGPQGPPGADGKDATETCTTCHNFSEFLLEKINQHNKSVHASGLNINRNGDGCAHCHTSQGFVRMIKEGSFGVVNNPNPINCRTCHPIHESYNASLDYKLRTTNPVNLNVGTGPYDRGNSNLCANCHQARTINPYPIAGGPDVTITNPRYGPHYGPQANLLIGRGPYEIPGQLNYVNSPHSQISDGCITCHMATPANGIASGGHQMNVSYVSYTGATAWNYNGCVKCHTDVNAMAQLRAQHREEIMNLQYALRDKLIEKGLLNQSELVPVPKTMSPNEAGAILNYKFVYGDQSYGAHNYPYIKALLVNTLASLE